MIFEKIKQLIAEQMGIDESKITMNSDIVKDLGADSLDIVEMLMKVEAEWDIVVDDADVEGLKTIEGVVNYIEKHAK